MDEVDSDIHSIQDAERRLVGRVGDKPAHVPVVRARTARERDDLVRFCEPRHERRPITPDAPNTAILIEVSRRCA